MIPLLGGTSANLTVDPEIKAAVKDAVEAKRRAVKVTVDAKGEKLAAGQLVPEGESLEEDFQKVAELLEDTVPCLVLIRLAETEWAMLGWTPDNAPVKLRMLCASSRKTLHGEFSGLKLKEYNATEKSEVTLAEFRKATAASTKEQRHAAMTQEEIDREEVQEQVAKEQRSAPKQLAGLVALQIKVHDSFEEAVKLCLAEEKKAVVGKLVGPKGEELSGEVLDDVEAPSLLKGRIPSAEPCYIVMRATEGRLLLLSWLPEDSPAKLKMRCSTFKSSVLDVIKGLAGPDVRVIATQASEEADLVDSLVAPPAAAAPGEAAEEASEGGGSGSKFKPPPGAMALPGMGGPGKPPPGGFALPGMGAGLPKKS
jgi:hypothetical protein